MRTVNALSADGELMTSLDLLHIPTPWHNSVVQLEESDVLLVTKAKLARAALAAGSVTGRLVRVAEGRAYFSLNQKKNSAALAPSPVLSSPEVVESEKEKGVSKPAVSPVTVASEEKNSPALATPQGRSTLSEKADVVVATVTRRNTGSLASAEPPFSARHDSWLGRLRWILSLFWPHGL